VNENPRRIQGDYISPEERIADLESQLGQGASKGDIRSLLSNPGSLQGMFKLSPGQAENVRALVVGAGTAASMKYLSKHIGDELAAIAGAAVTAYAMKKLLG